MADSGTETESLNLEIVRDIAKDDLILTLKITEDQTKLFLDARVVGNEGVKEPGVLPYTIVKLLNGTIEKDRIEQPSINHIAESLIEGKTVENVRIARGKAAKPGEDGKLVALVKKVEQPEEQIRRTAGDTRFVQDLQNIEVGMVVAKVIPPMLGTEGTDVFGQTIKPEPGKPSEIRSDKTIEVQHIDWESTDNSIRKIKILIVDDIPSARRVIKKLLNKIGFSNVVQTECSEAAFEYIKNDNIQLVICDMHLGEVSGVDIVRRVNEDKSFETPAFIMISSGMSAHELDELEKLKTPDYILKPFSAEMLEEKIAQTVCSDQYAEGTKLVAKTAGYFAEEKGVLKIKKELMIQGDVDISSGNVDFIGKVVIEGDVKKDFNVSAGKDIEINGKVLGGSLTSENGSIRVKGFVSGGPNYRIRCAKEFSAEIVQGVFIESQGDVVIGKEARDSFVLSRRQILAPKAHFFGGTVCGAKGIEAAKFGSEGGSETIVDFAAGIECNPEYASLLKELATRKERMLKLEQGIDDQSDDHEQSESVQEAGSSEKNEGASARDKLQQKIDALTEQLEKLKGSEIDESAFRVNFLEKMHKGVIVRYGEAEFIVQSAIEGPGTIRYDSSLKEFVRGEYRKLSKLT